MTILIISYTPSEVLFCSDNFRYYLTPNTVKDVLEHRLEVNHTNFSQYIEKIEHDCPKIHKLTRNCGVCCGGDGEFSDVIEGLNKRKNIPKQILQRLKQKKLDRKAFWSCHIARFNKNKNKVELCSIFYENGEIRTRENIKDNIEFSSFAPEMKDIFFKKYVMGFYLANTQEKIRILHEFFTEISKLYNNQAGGKLLVANVTEKGFKWLN